MSQPHSAENSDSDDEAPVNIVGDIPLEWYDEFDHVGYTSKGEKLIPKDRPNPIDEAIERSTNPDWWKKIYDKRNGEYKNITPELLDMIDRLRTGRVALSDFQLYTPQHESEYADKIHPLTNFISRKEKFQPSKSSLYKVSQYIAKIRAGESLYPAPAEKESIDIWGADFDVKPQKRRSLPPPKMDAPETEDSYNQNGGVNILDVEGYDKAIRERFERCSDLYLCPRKMAVRLPDTAAELLPELPDPEELRPFPTAEAIRFVGHTGRVRAVDVSPTGAILASGSSDGELKLWETQTGWCIKTYKLSEYSNGGAVWSVNFFPSKDRSIIAACCGKYTFLIRYQDDIELPQESETIKRIDDNIVYITHQRVNEFRQCIFSRTGAFLGLLGQSKLIFIYNTNTWEFRTPITSARSYIQSIRFHPNKPQLFVATQHHIIIFDLIERKKLMPLRPQVQWISSIDVHPRGDHVIAGSFDGRGFWFDTELQVTPFKVLRNHEGAVRSVAYHRRFPLFATASDDTKIDVFHCTVFDDLVTNPMIIPVKELSGHQKNNVLGVMWIVWHPSQPWLISAGADHTVRLWT